VPIQEVCHNIANAKDAPTPVLVRLAICQERHLEENLRQFLELQLITNDEYKQFGQEIENRLTTIWERVRAAEPRNCYSYIGMAMQQARARNFAQAIKTMDEGIAQCGKTNELVEKKSDILRRTDPAASLAFLESEHDERSLTLNTCKLIAQAALAAHRPDRALKFIAKAHALQPNLPWVCQLEAEALMQSGRPTEAAATLQRVLPQISADPVGMVAYIQALAASGNLSSAEAFLMKELETRPNNPVVAYGADSIARLGHLDTAVRILEQILQQQRDNSYAHFLLGDCLRQIAEQKPKGWDLGLVRESIQHYRATLDRYPNNLQAINNIAWLQLLALRLPRDAADSIKVMQQAADLPAPMLETVGAVLVANGSFDAGRKYLERSIRLGGERATTLAFLADAYRGLNRSTDALVAMRKSLTLPKNNPREAEIVNEVRQRIERSSP
jgi:tetratricopeptide (TPR) repeat protein